MIYLDNSATTKVDPEVVSAMLPYLNEEYGNPSSKHYTLAENAKQSVEESRNRVARLINAKSDEIIFTSGATESNNFIIKGISDYLFYEKCQGNHIITSNVEHKSVLETCKWLEKRGFKVTYLEVNRYGQVEPEKLENAITPQTILTSIIWGNNELGTLNDIDHLSKICTAKAILFHSDATQVLGKIDIDVQSLPLNLLSFSAHKIHGPKGIGGCFIRKTKLGIKQKITPLLHGGGQEFNYRAGTHSVHNIVGFGWAAEIAKRDMKEYLSHIRQLEAEFIYQINIKYPKAVINSHPNEKIPGIISLTLPGINNELLIRKLKNDIAISTGSACSLNEPSYVLKSIGLCNSEIYNTIRISISKFNKADDIIFFIDQFSNYI